MCGIIAVIRAGAQRGCNAVDSQIQKLRHRGPDMRGSTTVALPWGAVTLGMARLKIVDQSDIVVPYQFDYLDVALAYNGEVYNWRELRAELSDGTPWLTQCDSEVVARAWRRWGVSALPRFNGMWSFALVDKLEGCVVLARDRAGKKPLFYATRGSAAAGTERLYVASEAKALPVAMSATQCRDMDAFEFDCLTTTPLLGVLRLEPGHAAVIRRVDDFHAFPARRWWSLPVAERTEPLTTREHCEAVDELSALIVDSVRLRVAPAGVSGAMLLSGGLDSAIILAAWRVIDPDGAAAACKYCVDFSTDGIDNATTARIADPNVELVSMTSAEVAALVDTVVYYLDTPATWTALCLWKLAERISTAGHRIVLSGDGADELFGGYARYRILYWLDAMAADGHLEAYQSAMGHLLGGNRQAVLARMLDRGGTDATRAHVQQIIQAHAAQLEDSSLVRAAMRVEFHTTMQVLLRMADRMAAAWAIENRCPFLDYRIIEMSTQLPVASLVTGSESKAILRDVARALGVPHAIVDERTKRGLAIPWARWSTELGLASASDASRGAWDRTGFAKFMEKSWRKQCLRGATCLECPGEN